MSLPEITARRPTGSRFAQLWRIAWRSPNKVTRVFAWGELICFPVSVLSLVALVITAGVTSSGLGVPTWWTRYTLPLLCTASVGYLTNYLAVRMLFEPYSPRGWHWLRPLTLGLWKQGLIPARKEELGETVGKEISERLLTPEMITEEVARLAENALDDADFLDRLRIAIPKLAKEHLPTVIDRLTPQVLTLLRELTESGLTRDNMKTFLFQVVDPWLSVPENRERLVTTLVGLLQKQTPRIVRLMQETAERYGRRNLMSAILVSFAEGAGALDEQVLAQTINDQLRSPDSRRQFAEGIEEFVSSLQDHLDDPEMQPAIDKLKDKASGYIGELIHDLLAEKLPEKTAALVDSPAFWDWLGQEGLPRLKPAVLQWVRTDGYEIIGKRFDVAGRVKRAVDAMDVAMVHQMVDNVATEQLGAIQVLGFVLGFFAGIPLVLLL